MKRIRFPYGDERANKYIGYADSVFCKSIPICYLLRRVFGITQFVQRRLGVTEFWSDLIIVVGLIALVFIEQIITYHIDKRIQK